MKFLDLEGLGYFATKLIEKLPSIVREIINDIGFNKVNSSTTNGNILLDDVETKVYTLPDATASVLGGVKVGTNVSVSNGTISVADGSTSAKGVVQLTDSTTSTSTTTAATPNSVKSAYDLANTAKTVADGKANSSHTHTVANITDLTATAAELNFCDGVTSNIQTQLNGKAASSHTHNYAGSSSPGGAATNALSANNADTLDGYHADSFAKLSGANFTGQVTIVNSALNGTYNGLLIGDDCYIGDCNATNTIGLMGSTNNNIAYMKFGKNGGSLGYDGSNLVYNNSMVYTGQNITYGTNSLTPGTSSLATGYIYLQYE